MSNTAYHYRVASRRALRRGETLLALEYYFKYLDSTLPRSE